MECPHAHLVRYVHMASHPGLFFSSFLLPSCVLVYRRRRVEAKCLCVCVFSFIIAFSFYISAAGLLLSASVRNSVISHSAVRLPEWLPLQLPQQQSFSLFPTTVPKIGVPNPTQEDSELAQDQSGGLIG